MMEIDVSDYQIEVERYELTAPSPSSPSPKEWESGVTRRGFFKALGAGILILCLASEGDAQESGGGRRQRGGGGGGGAPRDIGAWIHVGEDGTVTAFSGKAEVGQNARTSLSMVVAEELRVPLASVRMVMADTELTPYDMGTFGSMTTPRFVPILREAAAAAREALIDLAVAEWKADRAALDTLGGKISQRGTSNSLTYGQLTKGRKLVQTIQAGVATTPAAQWTVLGHPAHKVNARDIVTGKHHYTSDVNRPGMLYGRVLRPDMLNATQVSVDTHAAEAIPGVKVVRSNDLTGVVAPSQHAANQAIAAVKAEWKSEPQVSSKELYEHLKKTSQRPGGRGGDSASGDVADAINRSEVKLQAEYTVAYIAHAPIEPRAAVAEWTGERLTVWTGTQRPFGVRQELAGALGIPESRIRVITPDTGSGYGGKHTGEAAIEAARLAKECGKPVKLVWTREEEFRWAYFRPAGVIIVNGGAAKDGTLLAWEFDNYNSGGSAIQTPYDVAAKRIQFHGSQSPLKQGSYRGLAATANNFARECHMDDMARALSIHPFDFRMKNLKDTRMRAVLQAAAEKFGWGRSRSAQNQGFGMACGTEKGSYVATCAEIIMNPPAQQSKGAFRVVRVTTAFECGAILNPEHLKNQVEGAVIQGLGGALFEAIDFENGRILNPRFSKYRVPRFGDVPEIQSVLLDRKDLPSAGAGETPIIAIAPAIGNAILDACGARWRHMPLMQVKST